MLLGGMDEGTLPGFCGKGEGPPGPGVDALEGAGDTGKEAVGGPAEAGGPEKVLGGVVKVEGPQGPEGRLKDPGCGGEGRDVTWL